MKRYLLNSLMFLGLLFGLLAFIPGHSIASGNAQKGSEGLTKNMPEVQWYADYAHVSLNEAVRRLRLQNVIDDMDANIRENYDDVFAGIYIEHNPEYKVVVQFARMIPSGAFQLIPEALQNDIEIRQVKFTQKELEKARAQAVKLLEKEGLQVISDIDTQENTVLLSIDSRSLPETQFISVDDIQNYLVSADNTLKGKLQIDLDRVKIAANTPGDIPAQSAGPEDYDWHYVKGGAMLRDANMNPQCTAGFTVWYGLEGKYGLSTAGHCADNEPTDVKYYFTYIQLHRENFIHEPPLDVAWHTPIGAWPVINQINIGSWGIRDIWADKWGWAQHPGDVVCKYGRTTGPECGFIKSHSFNGAQVKTYIFVNGGDSGGPFWLDDTAYGTTVSQVTWWEDWEIGWVTGSYYAPVDQLYNELHVRPLTWRP